jgi:Xaa-Pro aminopeptidase
VHGYAVPGATIDRVADVERLSAEALDLAVEQAGLTGQRIGIEEMHISAFHAAAVARHGPTVAVDGQIESLRRIKDDEELAAIRAAVGFNDLGFAAARQAIAPGVTELAVQDAVVSAMEEATGMSIDVLDDTNCFISGSRTSVGVGATTSRRLRRGDLMIIDLNPFIHGYKGDTTRTFSVGPASPEQRRIHDTLVRALEAAERAARPGVRACDVYAALARTIIDAGYGAGLSGHGGHAIGLEHLERPYIIPGDELPLEERMVLTLEPGIYLPEIGGLRIEDNYRVAGGGLDVLSHFPRELVRCG